jgi:hypothetical protein
MKPVIVSLTPLPDRPGDAPAEIRLRRALKAILRVYRIRAAWPEESKQVKPNGMSCPKTRK